MKNRSVWPPSIDEAEWNFASPKPLPEGEVAACFLYEYAREIAKNSLPWRILSRKLTRLNKLPRATRARRTLLDITNQMLGMLPKDVYAPLCLRLDFADTPWLRLEPAAKATAVEHQAQKKTQPVSFHESVCLLITLQRQLPEWESSGVRTIADWALLDRCFHGSGSQREQGFFAINWNYTDQQLKGEFEAWLKANRDTHRPVESEQGRNKKRQYLKALGAKRLLDAGFAVEQAMTHTEKLLGDKNGEPAALYTAARSWSVAKNRIVPQVLKQLLPGLRRRTN